MLVARGEDNLRYGYILTHADGSSVSADYASRAATVRKISGELERVGDLLYLRIVSDQVGI